MEQNSLWAFDRTWGGRVCGIDEAGRGPLAGPVVAACVCLRPGAEIPFLNDSKKMTEKRRNEAFAVITGGEAAWFGVGVATPEEIDSLNILKATFLAMNRACKEMLATMEEPPALALVDGNRDPGLPLPTRLVVKGDSASAAIAAASVVAKVTRDREMEALARQFPQYRFEQHKGYPVPLHYEMLAEHGISPVHRKSFLKNLASHIGGGKPAPANKSGVLGERQTESWLTKEGYTVLARNWRCPRGEVDIIARKGEILAFVEVKTRGEHHLGTPAEAVDLKKRKKIIETAQAFLAEQGEDLQPRFDVASVVTETAGGLTRVKEFTYYPGAFDGRGEP